MDTSGANDPSLLFVSPSPTSLSFSTGDWTDSETYIATYDFVDNNEELADVDVYIIKGWTDSVGNASPFDGSKTNEFDIDTVTPTLVASTPASGDVDVPVGDSIVLEFSEPIDPGTFNIQIEDETTADFTDYTVNWNGAGDIATVTLNSDLEYEFGYTVALGFKDTALNGPVYDHFPFTTGTKSSGGGALIPPAEMSIVINDDFAVTPSRDVSLDLWATFATQMIISNNSSFSGAAWEPFAIHKDWTLTEGEGTKTVYVKYKSFGGVESEMVSDAISYNDPSIGGGGGGTTPPPVDPPTTPEGYEPAPHTIDDYESGRWVKTSDHAAVYYLDSASMRHAYPTQEVWESYFGDDFSRVEIITVDELASYELGRNVPFNAGSLIKIPSVNKVYRVDGDAVLRWIVDEATAEFLYGAEWGSLIKDLPEGFFPDYSMGSPLQI
jgi:hypothetical protein